MSDPLASPPPLMPPMLTTCKTLPTEEKPLPSQQQKQKSKQSRNLPISVTIVILWQDGKNQNQFAMATSKSDRRSISHNLPGNVSVVLPLEDRLSSFNLNNRKTIIKAHMVKPKDEYIYTAMPTNPNRSNSKFGGILPFCSHSRSKAWIVVNCSEL